jgi:hypothetical protein
MASSDSEDDENDPLKTRSGSEQQKKAFEGITMNEFSKLYFPNKVMGDGMLFVWVEKEYIMDVCDFFEKQNFYYVESVCYIMLDPKMRKGKIRFLYFD